MLRAAIVFSGSMQQAREHTVLYDFLAGQVRVPTPFDDLLRAQLVASVAAFDKLIHDIIRIGVCEIFSGNRPATSKYKAESITLELHSLLFNSAIPPKEVLFEQAIVQKLRHLSFQHPDKISDGLSLIWPENQKWHKISNVLNLSSDFVVTKMKLIAGRRNAIVHESDRDPLTNARTPIGRDECNDLTDFLQSCGDAIVRLVQ